MGALLCARTASSALDVVSHPAPCCSFCLSHANAGRIFASNQRGDFTCHTYPVYKPINTKHFAGADAPLTLLPTHDANFDRLPWARTGLVGWSVALLLGPLFGAALVGAIYSAVAVRMAKKHSARVASRQKLAAVEDGLPPLTAGKDSAPAGS